MMGGFYTHITDVPAELSVGSRVSRGDLLAGKEYAEALQIRRELAQKDPETYQPDVAMTLNNLSGALNRRDASQVAIPPLRLPTFPMDPLAFPRNRMANRPKVFSSRLAR